MAMPKTTTDAHLEDERTGRYADALGQMIRAETVRDGFHAFRELLPRLFPALSSPPAPTGAWLAGPPPFPGGWRRSRWS